MYKHFLCVKCPASLPDPHTHLPLDISAFFDFFVAVIISFSFQVFCAVYITCIDLWQQTNNNNNSHRFNVTASPGYAFVC